MRQEEMFSPTRMLMEVDEVSHLPSSVNAIDGSQRTKGRKKDIDEQRLLGTTCTVKSTPDTPRKAGGSKAWSYAGLATVNPSSPPNPAENCQVCKQRTMS